MFADTVAGAIAGVRSHARLNELSQDIWKAYGSGLLTDQEAQRLAERLEARRTEVREIDRTSVRAPGVPRQIGASVFPVKAKRSYSPDRARSIERRRRLAASGPMPPAMACRYTTGELAALRIVADEVRKHGECTITIGELAARAGLGMTKARMAIRAAALDGLITIEERRQHQAPNLPNKIRIISREWRTWLARRAAPRPPPSTFVESTSTAGAKPVKTEDGSQVYESGGEERGRGRASPSYVRSAWSR